ncbi:MAG: type III-B CRISPR-associated protein Cas10/Cmr2 [Verrucomicrobiae bacterium]|nr:type III-B CRISPR-associated protein Cas10/Cmr2 [Verrucomicrobiae bacterium]
MTDWKRKLYAFLHDPPHKPFGIAGHEDERKSALIACGLDVEEMKRWQKAPDWAAAAADRMIFSDPDKSGVKTDWRDDNLAFRHPLAGESLTPRFLPKTSAVAEDWVTATLTGFVNQEFDHQKNFVRMWRLWRDRAASHPAREVLAYLVADTRIPDHTLWQHAAVVSALETCRDPATNELNAAFLLFQIGPVQEFIAQARKTQDLWAGSYLLSFLIAHGMYVIAEAVGPDAIIYPQLRGMPLLDWHWRSSLLAGADDLHLHPNELLTPNLPNRFLAVLPVADADRLAQEAAKAIRDRWQEIAESVRRFLDAQIGAQFPGWDALWESQVKVFPQIDYVVHPWAETEQALADAARGKPPVHGGWENHPLRYATVWAKEMIPPAERDVRCYKKNAAPLIDNRGFPWALHYAVTDWKFAAKKQMRQFERWKGHARPKDALDGKAEVIGPENRVEEFWEYLRNHPLLGEKKEQADRAERHFVGQQSYGALTIIKRLWARTYLGKREDVPNPYFDFDVCKHMRDDFKSVIELASGRKDTWEETDEQLQLAPEESYYAVLCFDGDEMGKWVSGAKAPPLVGQLSSEVREYFKKHWQPAKAGGLQAGDVRRVLTPSYHAALSEALSNYGLYCVRKIVEKFGGQLIYCGGDDVLAMFPAAKALACAEALYWTFRGQLPEQGADGQAIAVIQQLFEFPSPGFVRLRNPRKNEPRWPFIVMGPRATASAGIAIGHVRSPMQDTIQAARDAEQDAKNVYGRDAFCLRILKRSGEALTIGGKWRDNAETRHPRLVLLEQMTVLLADERSGLAGRFPYRLGQVLLPLGLDAEVAGLNGVLEAETNRVLVRQGKELSERDPATFQALHTHITAFRASLANNNGAKLRDYLGPFLAAAWLAKHPAPTEEVAHA